MPKAVLIVLDSLGIGALPDAHMFGETECNTLCNIANAVGGLKIPNLARLGLGNIIQVTGVSRDHNTLGAYGRMGELSLGMDTTIGHWEIAGLITKESMPTFPEGFPNEIITEFQKRIGRKILGNVVASGTEIIQELGEEHLKTGYPIIYTSADSVFQIAAHEEVIPLAKLYEYCRIARDMLKGPWSVGRVIARPFTGTAGNFTRTANRHDYSLEPHGLTILDALKEKGEEVIAVGKISDIFAGKGITKSLPTKDNQEGVEKTVQAWSKMRSGLVFTNLVEFDSAFGHRNDPVGYAKKIEEFDAMLPGILDLTKEEGILIITADHGNDPTSKSTDHNREYVPLLVYGADVRSNIDLGTRDTFADIAATIAEVFNITYDTPGQSFLSLVRGR